MDPGSDHSFIHGHVLPKGAVRRFMRSRATWMLNEVTNTIVCGRKCKAYYFQSLDTPNTLTDDLNVRYQMKIATHVLFLERTLWKPLASICNFTDQTITWLDNDIPYKPYNYRYTSTRNNSWMLTSSVLFSIPWWQRHQWQRWNQHIRNLGSWVWQSREWWSC